MPTPGISFRDLSSERSPLLTSPKEMSGVVTRSGDVKAEMSDVKRGEVVMLENC